MRQIESVSMSIISYEGYRETLSKLSRMYRESYRAGHKTANHWRELMRQVRADYPQHGDRFAREALGYQKREVSA